MSNSKKPNGAMPVIEKGVPLPTGNTGSYAALLRQMEIGDSVLFAGKSQSAVTSRAIRTLGKGNYTTRPEGTGTRVWRTA